MIDKVFKYHQRLLDNEVAMGSLVEKTDLTTRDIINNEIGWDPKTQTYVVPIKDENGQYIEIIKHSLSDEPNWIEVIGKAYRKIAFVESIKSRYHGKEIRFNGIIIGKDLSPYLIPADVLVSCAQVGCAEKCEICIMKDHVNMEKPHYADFEYTFRCQRDRGVLVEFIGSSDQQINGYIRKYFRIPSYDKCRRVSVDIINRQDVEEIMVTAELDYDRIDTDYVVQKAYCFTNNIKTNQQFEFYGSTWNDPRSQQSIHIINRSRASLDSIARWHLTPEIRERLMRFQAQNPNDDNDIMNKLEEYQRDIAHNVTRIKKRDNIIMGVDLVYHSVLQFDFLGHRVTKGWMECLIGGDTRTGKTETVKNILHHYKAGEFLTSGENITIAGILGGVQQTHNNSRWSLTWGKLPLNDRGLCAIDEIEELVKKGIMGNLSGVRSSGVAEVTKIQARRTFARTRIIFIANPIQGRVSEYNFGVNIVKELMGQQQDIARLDFAMLCAKEDISDNEINQRDDDNVEHVYTSALCHDRVMFAWTRRPEQVYFGRDTEDIILYGANEMGKKYSAEVPLVIGAEMRIKLARMATSIAAMTYSVDEETGEILIVRPAHVIVAIDFLQNIYNSHVMGYAEYSEQRRAERVLKNITLLDAQIDDLQKVNMLLTAPKIQPQDIEDIFSCDKIEARNIVSMLRKAGAIKKTSYYYRKSPPFIEYLKTRRHDIVSKKTEQTSSDDATPFDRGNESPFG